MTINVGIIGYGLSGSVFHAPLIKHTQGLRLKTIVSRSEQVHKDYPEVEVVHEVEMLLRQKEIEVVVVTSPNTTHYEYAKKAILAGKHVVVEKPFTITSSEAEDLIVLAREKGVLLTVYHNRRWDNDFLTIQELLRSGILGRLTTYEAHYDRFRPCVRDRWREKKLSGSGTLYDLGAHLIDQALVLFGMPQTVWADLRAERAGAQAVDYFHLILGYQDLRVILHGGSLVRETGPRYMLHGDKGSFVKYGLDPQEEQLKNGIRPGASVWGEDRPDNYGQLTTEIGGLVMRGVVETLPGRYETFYKSLVEAIQLRERTPVLAEEARNTIHIIECAIRSQQEQRTINMGVKNDGQA
jgi:scyllo-inositol 2-dehydrogenase (NADP+)